MDSRERHREHGRVRMHLPVRLRWSTPFGQKIELGETLDVSRGGLLVSTKEPHTPGVMVWVTSPFDASLRDGQPEIFARVVRCEEVLENIGVTLAHEKNQFERARLKWRSAKSDQPACDIGISHGPPAFAVAFHFEPQPRTSSNGNSHHREPERRGSVRKALAIPVRIYPEGIPWFEEAMTMDISATGMRLRSHREYTLGDRLKIAFEDPATAPWHGAGEFHSEVVRVAPVPGSAALEIGVRRVN